MLQLGSGSKWWLKPLNCMLVWNNYDSAPPPQHHHHHHHPQHHHHHHHYLMIKFPHHCDLFMTCSNSSNCSNYSGTHRDPRSGDCIHTILKPITIPSKGVELYWGNHQQDMQGDRMQKLPKSQQGRRGDRPNSLLCSMALLYNRGGLLSGKYSSFTLDI